jgi:hypothetical protein
MAIVGPALFLRSRAKKPVQPANFYVLREAILILAGFGLYESARIATRGSSSDATANANNIASLERRIGIFSERQFQEFMSGNDSVVSVLNFVYSHGFLSTCLAVLVWTFVVDGRRYRLLRDAMGISALLAIVTIALLPVAPPRLMPGLGIADTVVLAGNEHHFANQYAAMPSLHVGWMMLAGVVAGLGLGGRRGVLVGLLPGIGMLAVVVTTGNHYWLDGVVGTAYALTGIGISEGLRRSSAPSRLRFLAAIGWDSVSRARGAVSRSPQARLTTMATVGLTVYLLTAQAIEPGFTDFWGYLLFQALATLGLLTAGECMLAEEGGLSWQTHLFAVVCLFADTIGTDGNLYAQVSEYDKFTHFLGVAAITSGLAEAFRVLPVRGFARPAAAPTRVLIAIGLGIGVGIGWEMYEYLGDMAFHTTRVQGTRDTAFDLVFDTLGATGAGFLGWRRNNSVLGVEREIAGPTG